MDDIDQKRRGFLKRVVSSGYNIAAVATVAGVAAVPGSLINRGIETGIDATLRFIREAIFQDHEIDALPESALLIPRQLLFGSGDHVRIIPAKQNPYELNPVPQGQTIPASMATSALTSLLRGQHADRVADAGSLIANDLSGNLVVVGGPIANEFTAALMGQAGIGSLIQSSSGLPFKFPIFLNNQQAIADVALGNFTIRAGSKRPVWFIQLENSQLRPKFTQSGILEDYVKLTSIPNFLDRPSFELGRRIIIFCGANGAGTKSVGLAVKSSTVFDRLLARASAVDPASGWQAVFHTNVVKENEPASFSHFLQFRPLDVDWTEQATRFEDFRRGQAKL